MKGELILTHDEYVNLQERLMMDIDPDVYDSSGMKYWDVVDKLDYTFNLYNIKDESKEVKE